MERNQNILSNEEKLYLIERRLQSKGKVFEKEEYEVIWKRRKEMKEVEETIDYTNEYYEKHLKPLLEEYETLFNTEAETLVKEVRESAISKSKALAPKRQLVVDKIKTELNKLSPQQLKTLKERNWFLNHVLIGSTIHNDAKDLFDSLADNWYE